MILLSLSVGLTWVLAAVFAVLDGRRPLVGWLAAAGMAASFVSVVLLGVRVIQEGPVEMVAGDWPKGLGITLRADALGVAFAAISGGIILVAYVYELLSGRGSRTFPAFILFLNSGLMGIFLTGDIFNFYVFFEVSMTAAYVLTGYWGQAAQLRAAFIFAIVNLLGSVIFVIAVAALYRLTGSLDMQVVAERAGQANFAPVLMIAVAIFVAFGLKLGLFPFHFWLPTVYVGSHASITAILSGAVANIGNYGLLRFGGVILPEQLQFASPVLLVVGASSILYGALQAVARHSPKEVMSYSAIGQVGYILVALGIGGPVGFTAATLYALVNSLNKLLLFLCTGVRGPLVGTAFAVGAFSVAGVPPAAGFLGKLTVFWAALAEAGSTALSALLVALVVVGGALSLVYSFQIYQKVYMRPSEPAGKPSPAAARVLVIVVAALLVGLGLWPEPLLFISDRAGAVLAGG